MLFLKPSSSTAFDLKKLESKKKKKNKEMMQSKSIRLFGVVLSTGNSTVNGDGGGGIHQHNSMTTDDHDTKQVLKLFGKVICPLSTHDHHDHDNHPDQRMINNDMPNPSRKRGRSSSASASTTTTASLAMAKQPKKARSPRPSKEEIRKARSTFPPLPPEIQQKMTALGADERSEPMLILQKLVTKSDVDNQQARFLIPKGQLLKREDEFLGDEELKKLNEGKGEMKVKVIQRSAEVRDREMTLTLWPKLESREKVKETKETEPSVRYSLQTEWNKVKSESSINKDDVVQVWAFRYGEKKDPGFALLNLGPLKELKIC